MSRTIEPLLAELEQESHATRRLLERVPADRLTFRPHARSMTLGQLALHVATIPRGIPALLSPDALDLESVDLRAKEPASLAEVLAALDDSLRSARKELEGWDEARATAPWRLRKAGQVVMEAPRAALLRTLLLNHLVHHRGQLTVYLRLLDVPLPSTYGPSADLNPFA